MSGWSLADGTFIPREERGVHWRRHRRQGSLVAYIVDSAGDDCGIEELLPILHSEAQLDALYARLWALLDGMDPVADTPPARPTRPAPIGPPLRLFNGSDL